MAYAAFATGHKGQTFDLTTGFNLNRQLAGPVLPETSESYEIGARMQFYDHRLTVNTTIFDVHYDDFQAQGIEFLPDGSFNFRLSNVGKVRTRGVEIDSVAVAGEHLNLNASLAYVDAVIEEFPLGQCYPGQTAAQGCSGTPARQDLSGHRPPQAPEFKATAGFDYSRPLNGGSLNGVLQGAYVYQSAINYALSGDPEGAQGGYGLLNLSIGSARPGPRLRSRRLREQRVGQAVLRELREQQRQFWQPAGDQRGAAARFRTLRRNSREV